MHLVQNLWSLGTFQCFTSELKYHATARHFLPQTWSSEFWIHFNVTNFFMLLWLHIQQAAPQLRNITTLQLHWSTTQSLPHLNQINTNSNPTELYCQLTEPLYNHEECGTATPNLTLVAAARQGQNQQLYLAVLQNMMVLSHSTGVAILVRELHKAIALWHACLVTLKLHSYCWACNCSCLRSCHCPVLFQNLQRPQSEWEGGREREMI